jgi:hypothetical protein
MFFSAFLTYISCILYTKIKTKYISRKTNQQFDDNNIKNLQFIVKEGVRSSLVIYLIMFIVSKIRFKQHQKKKTLNLKLIITKICFII